MSRLHAEIGEHMRDREGDAWDATLTSRKTGKVIRLRFFRAVGILGVGASGYWVSMDFGDGRFASVGHYTTAEPLRGWVFGINKKWKASAPQDQVTWATWIAERFNAWGGVDGLERSCRIDIK